METKLKVLVRVRAYGGTYARPFPTVSAARAFVLRRNDQNGVSDMRIEVEGRVVAELSDIISSNVGWSQALDAALLG